MTGPLDHLLFLAVAVAWPLWSWRTWPSFERDVRERGSRGRVRGYLETYAIEWGLLAACLVVWVVCDRPLATLGLTVPDSSSFRIASGLVLVLSAFLLAQVRRVRTASADELASLGTTMETVLPLLPHTPRERSLALGLAFTAGVCEEILYRAFVIGYLAAFAPLWVAVLGSTVIFGLGHAYQGAAGALKCGAVGLLAALLFVLSGSILPAIVLHVVVDVQGLLVGYEVARRGLGRAATG